LRFTIIRSGLGESVHEVDVHAVDAAGNELLTSGDPDRPIYYRSTVKPFQATIALEVGLRVPPEHLALVCASHSGWPEHLAIVRRILAAAGLDETNLQTPPAWPLSEGARALQQGRGAHFARSIFHNCSGKHAGMLAAIAGAGWPTENYLDPTSTLQSRILDLITAVTGVEARPAGVDQCGSPAARGTVRGLARGFAALTVDDRFSTVADAMSRFPALVADNERPDGLLGRWWGGPVKAGAEGSIGLSRHGIGIAAKARSGSGAAAVGAAIIAADRLGLVSEAMGEALAGVTEPVIFGGGRPVGAMTLA
jgi:L-asparaginase II